MKFSVILFLLGICTTISAQNFRLDTNASQLKWTGSAAFSAYELSGTIDANAGSLEIEQGKIKAAAVKVNTRSINSDITRLKKHLKSEDFFYVKKYPDAYFTLTEFVDLTAETVQAIGNLTIRDQTHPIKLKLEVIQQADTIVIKGKTSINRIKYGVNHNSPSLFASLKDEAIADEFLLAFELSFVSIR